MSTTRLPVDQVVSLTMDMDWAPPEVIQYALDLLDEHSVQCTLFVTGAAAEIDFGNHELALHPHCSDLPSTERNLVDLLDIVPDAIGVRWHSLFHTQRMLPLYAKHGIRYESNVMMYDVPRIVPYRLTPSIWELPIFFMDNVHLWMTNPLEASFNPMSLSLESNGLKIFAFHPIHIFLNTDTMQRYEAARPYFGKPDRLRAYANPESSGSGIRVLLRRLLDFIQQQSLQTWKLHEILEAMEGSCRAVAGSVAHSP